MINRLTITQLVENTVDAPGLLAEHGVSYLIEADGHQLLFDTGQGMALRHNLERLGLTLASVDSIVLSHGHYDHSGGLLELLEMTGPVNLYLHPQALHDKFNRNGREIGIPFTEPQIHAAGVRQLFSTAEPEEILPGVHITGEIPRTNSVEDTGGPFYLESDCHNEDILADDQALYIEMPEGLVVLLGCGHAGVVNTLEQIRKLSGGQSIHALLGGMHLLRANPERLAFTADYLERTKVQYLAPNHCTGLEAVCYFMQRLPGIFHPSNVGAVHQFGVDNP